MAMIIFDYTFYRVAKFFYRKDGIEATRAIATVTFIQGALLSAFLVGLLRLFYDLSDIAKFSKISSTIGLALTIIIAILNYLHYKGKYWKLANKWKDKETKRQKNFRGIFVIFMILVPFILFFWMGTSGYRD